MNILEQNIYVNATKASVNGFQNFVDLLLKHDNVVSDAELIHTIKQISRKLQIVISKWDQKLYKATSSHSTSSTPSQIPEKTDAHDYNLISSTFEKVLKNTSDSESKPGCSHNTNTMDYSQEKSVMMMSKNIDEKLLVGTSGFYVKEICDGIWTCTICQVPNLSLSNLLSHVRGKAHKKKITSIGEN